jgi:hypothetical protein
MFLRTTILALSLVGVLTACGEDKTPPAASVPASPTAPVAPAAPESAPAPAAPGTLALPDDLPSWPGAEVVASGGDPAEGMIVSMRARRATPEEVFTFYRDGLAASGWKVEGEVKSEDGSMLVAARGSRRATLMIAPDDDSVEISVTVTNATD